jgi:hypothetical protein
MIPPSINDKAQFREFLEQRLAGEIYLPKRPYLDRDAQVIVEHLTRKRDPDLYHIAYEVLDARLAAGLAQAPERERRIVAGLMDLGRAIRDEYIADKTIDWAYPMLPEDDDHAPARVLSDDFLAAHALAAGYRPLAVPLIEMLDDVLPAPQLYAAIMDVTADTKVYRTAMGLLHHRNRTLYADAYARNAARMDSGTVKAYATRLRNKRR